jgi:hypothetical protein
MHLFPDTMYCTCINNSPFLYFFGDATVRTKPFTQSTEYRHIFEANFSVNFKIIFFTRLLCSFFHHFLFFPWQILTFSPLSSLLLLITCFSWVLHSLFFLMPTLCTKTKCCKCSLFSFHSFSVISTPHTFFILSN